MEYLEPARVTENKTKLPVARHERDVAVHRAVGSIQNIGSVLVYVVVSV
jgi:hypothetical protein